MLNSLLQIVIGAGATVGYLSLWNRILKSTAAARAEGNEGLERRFRQRRRLAQLVLFLMLTPYVLIVFRLMDWVSAVLVPTGG